MSRVWQRVAVAILCCAVAVGVACGREATADAKATGTPTPEDARKFIDAAEQNLFDLGLKASRASWVQENFITDDTEQLAADAGEALNTAATKTAKEAHRY